MQSKKSTYSAIEENFDSIRRAIDNRAYDELDLLLAEQRVLIGNLPFADPEAQAYFVQAQDLTAWSLTVVRMQRSALEQSLSSLARLRQIEKYRHAALVMPGQ
ncbi:MAG TPA: hypothetical protein VLJ11_00310 [Bryobacteraceae bacterium]|nr:hypothetical protein [Bryobacteraceae bacterium]